VWRIGESISGALARIEVGLEFVEDQFMSDVGNPKAELDGLTSVRDEVGELLRSYDRGKLATVGATVVLVGAPNVGKSSLLNTLLGHERAIVTPVPGTTRDVVEGEIDLDGIRVRLLDTAGIRDTDDVVEQEGTRRARAAAERSDLSVLVLDGSGAVPLNLESWPVHGIVALNKWDIRVKEVESEAIRNVGETPLVRTTATTGDGIGDLCGAIASALTEGIPDPTGAVVLSERHADALSQTAEALDRALVEAKGRGEADLVAADLRLALDSVGLITGETTPDDVLRAIFDGFCVGK
jgi:tRNA modification GTPase